jgi:hypothetical protein
MTLTAELIRRENPTKFQVWTADLLDQAADRIDQLEIRLRRRAMTREAVSLEGEVK